MSFYYTSDEGLSQRIQQSSGALEFTRTDTININGARCAQFDVRKYNPAAGWEFFGRINVLDKKNVMARAVAEFIFGDESQWSRFA